MIPDEIKAIPDEELAIYLKEWNKLLCETRGGAWQLHIPPQAKDPDLLIAEAARRLRERVVITTGYDPTTDTRDLFVNGYLVFMMPSENADFVNGVARRLRTALGIDQPDQLKVGDIGLTVQEVADGMAQLAKEARKGQEEGDSGSV
jgi:hypothetical protein